MAIKKHKNIVALVREEGSLTVLPREKNISPCGIGGNWCVEQLDKIAELKKNIPE
jgi:hypothetical protein